MDALRNEETYTIDDIYALPDGERAELIDGKIYYMATPSRTHQKILSSRKRISVYYFSGRPYKKKMKENGEKLISSQ